MSNTVADTMSCLKLKDCNWYGLIPLIDLRDPNDKSKLLSQDQFGIICEKMTHDLFYKKKKNLSRTLTFNLREKSKKNLSQTLTFNLREKSKTLQKNKTFKLQTENLPDPMDGLVVKVYTAERILNPETKEHTGYFIPETKEQATLDEYSVAPIDRQLASQILTQDDIKVKKKKKTKGNKQNTNDDREDITSPQIEETKPDKIPPQIEGTKSDKTTPLVVETKPKKSRKTNAEKAA